MEQVICPDCNAPVINNELEHESTCPLIRGIDEVSENDRQWFDAHPGATEYWRAPYPAELVEFRELNNHSAQCTASGRVQVTWLTDSLRARDFQGLVWSCEAKSS